MRRWIVVALLLAAPAGAKDTCANRTSCEGKLKTQILAAFPAWAAKLDGTCMSLLYAGYPHCAQIAVPKGWEPPTIVYGETDITTGAQWPHHAVAPGHRPGVTPDAILGSDQQQGPAWCRVDEYGDTRSGTGVGYCVACRVRLCEPGQVNCVLVEYTRGNGPRDCNVPGFFEVEP